MLLSHQQGFSLIEVMVAAAILSFSLLGFARAQLIALQASEHAYLINLADLKNIELAENFAICASRSFCLQQVVTLWKKEVQESFPKGKGSVSKLNLSNYQSNIQWFSSFSKLPSSLNLLFRV
ncbi:type IV pilus modification PilV family protein [Rickettsiella endosymbiont of Aleochara curtula]|uniref:type IV pilus modification PilV family protein n=1 Tax=Rickettsiella endosymbiont of Aleochara curtula TaxID=3077936 RepID=UPI00313E13F1